ncbi:MAG: hypothetical protein QOE09_3143 [Ilumatobacteraceae bacterium]
MGNPAHFGHRTVVHPIRYGGELQIVSNGRRLGSAVAALLVLTACGPSGHRYLANREEKVYLRVPTSWHDIRLSATIQDPLLQATSDAKIISKTVVSPQKDALEQKDLSGDTPFATMTVYETTGAFNQQLSASLARRAVGLVPYDPLLPGTGNEGLSEVLDFDPNPHNATITGSRVVFRARNDTTSDWVLTVNLSTYFDPSSSRLYALEVICNPACYTKDSGEINTIVNSWRIG